MAKKRPETIYIGGRFDSNMSARFHTLCEAKGISMQEGLRRIIVDAIQRNAIPGVQDMILEDSRREAEKGHLDSVPTYDGNAVEQA